MTELDSTENARRRRGAAAAVTSTGDLRGSHSRAPATPPAQALPTAT